MEQRCDGKIQIGPFAHLISICCGLPQKLLLLWAQAAACADEPCHTESLNESRLAKSHGL